MINNYLSNLDSLFLALLFSMIPAISFLLQYYFSKRDNTFKHFKRHFWCYYLDWLFVPFNLLFVYVVFFNLNVFYFSLIISIIINFIMHYYWYTISNNKSHFFNKGMKSFKILRNGGIVHFIFSSFEMTLILMLIFCSLIFPLAYAGYFLLLLFFIGYFPASKYLHGKFEIPDIITGILGIMALIIKLVFFS